MVGFQAPLGVRTDTSNAVIIFDWDDTLCPTWWSSSASGHDGDGDVRLDIDLHREELREHAAAVEQILRAARSVAQLGIVTLAKREWFNSSSRRLFPDLDIAALFAELGIFVHCAVVTRRCYDTERDSMQPCILAKKKSMSKCLQQLYRGNQDRWNVTSVGDSKIEQNALHLLLTDHARSSVCKTVKFTPDPTLQTLTSQLESLTPHIPRIASYPRDFDWTSTTLFLG
jgi:hypothetical protein